MDTADLEQFFPTAWATTVTKSKSLLDPDDLETVETFKSWENLVDWLLESAPASATLIRPALGHLHVFAAFFQTHLAPSLDASYLWGSLACLLQLVCRRPKTSDQILRMIKSLALKAEAFNGYCEGEDVTRNVVKEVCFDIQVRCSYSSLRASSGVTNSPSTESGEDDYSNEKRTGYQQRIQTNHEMATLDISEALSRLKKPTHGHSESVTRQPAPYRCIMMPATKTSRFFDRIDIFLKLDEILAPDLGEFSLQSVALYGLSGVGKSSIASSYAEKKFSEHIYDVVLWVCGEKEAFMRQSMTDIAMRLKLPGAQPHSHDENQVLVQEWFRNTECKWLVIYDNVESASLLARYWPPPSNHGRAIVTSCSRSLAFEPAASGIEVAPWDVETGAEFLLFLLKKKTGLDSVTETCSALTLSQRLSGHALALASMAGLIYEGEYSVQDFTTMYLENPRSAHAMDEMATLFDFAFRSLDKNSFSLMGILSFLMPDNIPPEIFEPGSEQVLPSDLVFLRERLTGFSAALRKLTARALIKRDEDSGILSVHRITQTQFRYFLALDQRQRAFDNTVALMSCFVEKSRMEKGQLFDAWGNYNRYLQHVLSLRDIFIEERRMSQSFKASKTFCEMLADYQRYLYERCNYDECERTCAANRDAVTTLTSMEDRIDLEATIISHESQILEDLGKTEKAIELCQQNIDIRLSESPRKEVLLAFSTGNLGVLYHDAHDFTKALECFHKSREWWAAHFNKKGGNWKYPASFSTNEARCMIDLNRFDKAKELLSKALAQVQDEKPLNFGLMAYVYFCMGTLHRRRCRFESAEKHYIQAQNAWLTGDQTRVHPFNAAILYKIGACCLDQGKTDASIKHVTESVEVTDFYHRIMPVEHFRSLFKLSEALLQNGDDNRARAASIRESVDSFWKQRGSDVPVSVTEKAFDDLIPIERR